MERYLKDQKLLEEYSEEMELLFPLTVERLIESHRTIRNISKKFHEKENKMYNRILSEWQEKMIQDDVIPKSQFKNLIREVDELLREYENV